MRLRLAFSLLAFGLFTGSAHAAWTQVSSTASLWIVSGQGSALLAADSGAVQMSLDSGRTWKAVAGPKDVDYAFLGFLNGRWWLGTDNQGLAYSTNPQKGWSYSNTGMKSAKKTIDTPITGLVTLGSSKLFANGFYSSDGGSSWSAARMSGFPNDSAKCVRNVCDPPAFNGIAVNANGELIAATDSGLYRSTDRGATWSSAGLANQRVAALAAGVSAAFALLANGDLYRYSGKAGWSKLSAGSLSFAPSVLYVHPSKAGVVAAGDASGKVAISIDNGSTWKLISDASLPSQRINALAIPADRPETLLAATAGGIYRYEATLERAGMFFPSVNQAALSSTITSAEIVVSGLSGKKSLSIDNGKYSLNGGAFTEKSGTVGNGDKIVVQVQSSAKANTTTQATLNVGGVKTQFTVTTAFAFAAVSAAALDARVVSGELVMRGLDKAAPISIEGGTFSINGKDFTSRPGSIVNGAKLRVAVKSAKLPRTLTSAMVTIGKLSARFDVTTQGFTKVSRISEVLSDIDNAQLNDDGTISITATTSVKLLSTPLADAILKLTKDTPLANNNGTLIFTAKSDDANVKTRDTTSGGALQVVSGTYDVQSSATNYIPVGTGNLRTGNCTTALKMRNSGVTTQTQVKNCTVYFQTGSGAGGFAAESGTAVYSGEVAEVDNEGTLTAIRIGSLDGDEALPGDPLKPAHLSVEESIPRLDGKLARLGNATLLDVIKAALDDQFDATGTIAYDSSSGVVTYTVGGQVFHLIPLGTPTVQIGNGFSATSSAATASGAFTLASQGIQITLAGTFGYFGDLDSALKSFDPGATMRLRSSGAVQIRLQGADYICAPGANAAGGGASAQTPTFQVDASGLLGFVDSRGALQTLYPTFADIATVTQTVQAVDGSATVSDNGSGSATMNMAGTSYTLKPEYLLESAPTSRAEELWWPDGSKLYLRYHDGTAQSFTIPQ